MRVLIVHEKCVFDKLDDKNNNVYIIRINISDSCTLCNWDR